MVELRSDGCGPAGGGLRDAEPASLIVLGTILLDRPTCASCTEHALPVEGPASPTCDEFFDPATGYPPRLLDEAGTRGWGGDDQRRQSAA